LLVAAARRRPSAAAGMGMLWGIGIALGVGWPLPQMVANYLGASMLVGWLTLLAVGVALTGIYVAAFAAWVSWLGRRGAASPLVVAAGWTACEFARSRLLVGNPWALAGYSQLRATPLVQIADVAGPYGVSFVVAAVNAVLAGLLVPALAGPHPRRSRAAVVGVLAATLIYGEWRLAGAHDSEGDPVRVAVVQGSIDRAVRSNPEHRAQSVDRYLELSRRAAASAPQIVFWPEYAVDFYLQEASVERDRVLGVDRELAADLIVGGPHYTRLSSGARYHNSVFLIRDGAVADRYDKLRLVPFAEEPSLRWLFPGRAAYEPGRAVTTLGAAGTRVGAFVCFESMYPELVRRFALAGAEVLANLSNDDWFGDAAPARMQLDMASFRAIENRRYLVRATTSGFSAIVDPFGRQVVVSEMGKPEALAATVRPLRTRTLYQLWGDAFAWLAVALVLGSAVKLRPSLHFRARPVTSLRIRQETT
jgi:apolipoprotein N-acyltransferase